MMLSNADDRRHVATAPAYRVHTKTASVLEDKDIVDDIAAHLYNP